MSWFTCSCSSNQSVKKLWLASRSAWLGCHCNTQPSWIITHYVTLMSQNQLFPLMKCIHVFNNMCRMGRWSFWSWFDENRSTFDEDMPEKDLYIFVPGDLGLRFKFIFNTNALTNVLHYVTLQFAPLVAFVRYYLSSKSAVFTALVFREKRRHRMDGDGRTDRREKIGYNSAYIRDLFS